MPYEKTPMERLLLDSAVKYERLKPIFYNLQNAYEYRGKEVQDLREALRLSDLQIALQKQKIAEKPKRNTKPFWTGFKVGGGTVIIITIALLIL